MPGLLDWIGGIFGSPQYGPPAPPSGGMLTNPQGIREQALYGALGQLGAGLLAAGARRPVTQPSPLPQALAGFGPAYRQGIQTGQQEAAIERQADQERRWNDIATGSVPVPGLSESQRQILPLLGSQLGPQTLAQMLTRGRARDVPATEAQQRLGANFDPRVTYQEDQNGMLHPVTTPSMTAATETARVGVTGLDVPGQGGSRYFPFGLPGGAAPGVTGPAAPPRQGAAPQAPGGRPAPMQGMLPPDSTDTRYTGPAPSQALIDQSMSGPPGQPIGGPVGPTRGSGASGMTPPPQMRVSPGPGGRGVSIGAPPDSAAPATITDLQRNAIDDTQRLGRLQDMANRFNPEWLTYSGRLTNWGRGILERAGMDIGPEGRRQLGEYEGFRATVANEFNQTLRALSGAAVTPNELERMQAAAPSLEDSPTQFQSKLQTTIEAVALANARRHYMLSQGLRPSFTNSDSVIPLSQMRGIIEARGNELFRALQTQGVAEAAARARVQAQLRQEFGMGSM